MCKQVTKMSRLTGQLEKVFNMLNHDFFDDQIPPCIITVSPTAHAYAHFSTGEIWTVKESGMHEINLSSQYLDRDPSEWVASILHEQIHAYDYLVLGIPDCSNGGYYHSKVFKESAEAHGLICSKTPRYGWAYTEASDELLQWILDNDIPDIRLCRAPEYTSTGSGSSGTSRGSDAPGTKSKSNSRRYVCPRCNAKARTTKDMTLICGDCMEMMVYTGN